MSARSTVSRDPRAFLRGSVLVALVATAAPAPSIRAQAPAEPPPAPSPTTPETPPSASETSAPATGDTGATTTSTAMSAAPARDDATQEAAHPLDPAGERRSEPPTRLGPARIPIPNGDVSVGLATQFRSNVVDSGGSLGDGGRQTDSNMEIRRMRLYVRGNFLDERLAFLLQLSTSPSSLELLDLSLDGVVHDDMHVRFGVFKTPYTLHRNRSFQNLPMSEWDAAAVRFGAERQYGVELHGTPSNDAYLDYSIGVFTGQNSRSSFERGVGEIYDEPLPNLSNLRSAQPPTEVHPEVMGRIGYATKNADPLNLSDPRGGSLRAYGALSAAYDFRAVEQRDFDMRLAAEGMIKAHHLTVNAIGYLGMHDAPGRSLGVGMTGLTLDATYRVLTRLEFAVRYSAVASTRALRRSANDYLAGLVAAADPADVPDLLADHSDTGTMRRVEEYAVGINVPIVGRSLVVQTDFALVRTDRVGSAGDDDSFRWRSQLQFGF